MQICTKTRRPVGLDWNVHAWLVSNFKLKDSPEFGRPHNHTKIVVSSPSLTACSGGYIVSWIIYCWLVWCERKTLFSTENLQSFTSKRTGCKTLLWKNVTLLQNTRSLSTLSSSVPDVREPSGLTTRVLQSPPRRNFS